MPKFIKCPEEVHALARKILREFETHAPLLKAKVEIDLVFALAEGNDAGMPGRSLRLGGYPCLGIARIIKYKDRVMGRGDVEVSIDGDWWAKATEAERRALLDHELHHFEIKMKGDRILKDDEGRPLVGMRKHDFDFGWFEIIAARHGLHSQEVQQARRMMEKSGKVLLGQMDLNFGSGEIKHTEVNFGKDLAVNSNGSAGCDEDEDLIQQCIEVIRSEQKASVSLLQRRKRIGYTQAARIMDELESRGIVGPSKGSEPRDILIDIAAQPSEQEETTVTFSMDGSKPVTLTEEKFKKAAAAVIAGALGRRKRK